MREENSSFNDLQRDVKKPTRKAPERAEWISESTWRLEDHRMILSWNHYLEQ